MKPIDYLRAKARARKPAIGGTITEDQAAQIAVQFAQANDRPCHMRTEYRPPTTAVITFDVPLTQSQIAELKQRITIRTPSADKNCGCWPRYSNCGCKP